MGQIGNTLYKPLFVMLGSPSGLNLSARIRIQVSYYFDGAYTYLNTVMWRHILFWQTRQQIVPETENY